MEKNTRHSATRNLVFPNLQTTLDSEGRALSLLASLQAATSSSQSRCMRSAFLLASSSLLRGRMSAEVRPLWTQGHVITLTPHSADYTFMAFHMILESHPTVR